MTDDLKTAGDSLIAAAKEWNIDYGNIRTERHKLQALGDYKGALIQHIAQTGDITGAEKSVDFVTQSIRTKAQELLHQANEMHKRPLGLGLIVKDIAERGEQHASELSSMADALKADMKNLAHISNRSGKNASVAIPEALGALAKQAVGPQAPPEGRRGGR
jgi:hypothetical protein